LSFGLYSTGEETSKHRKRRGQLAQKDSRPIQPSGPVQPVSCCTNFYFHCVYWVIPENIHTTPTEEIGS
jgi:hypothetical protein